jgi:hypothetical protein
VINVHVAVAVAVAATPAQVLLPRAVTVLVTEQAFVGDVNVAEKLTEAPGARLGVEKTVLGDACAFTTVTLINVTLPEFRTVPL